MKKLSRAMAIAVFLTFGSAAFAQSLSSVAVIRPCTNDTGPGRPVLKRRAPTPDEQPAPVTSEAKVTNAEPCEPATSEANTAIQKTLPVRFEGLTAVSEADLRLLVRETRIALPENLETSADLVTKAEAAIREFLISRGYRHAMVSSRFDQNDKEPAVLTFVINEGARFRISEIRFEGNRIFSSELLAAKMKEYLTHFHQDEPEPDRFDAEVFNYCLHRLTQFERAQGHLQARFAEPKIEEEGGSLVVTLHSNEGVLYRLGTVEIEGADHVAEQQIRAMLDMRRGEVASGEKIAKCFYEDLKEVYGEKGFIQYTAEITPEFHLPSGAAEGVVDFTITIDEGRSFKIRKILFRGDRLPEPQLRQLLLIREGGVYDQRLFELSLKKIDETGLFYLLDKDSDVDYRTNEEEGLVDLEIKVTRRETAVSYSRIQ
jgi:outer membrane protein insertion porin family